MQFSAIWGDDCHGVSCMGCWILDAGYWILDFRFWILDTGIGTMIGLQWRRTLQHLSIGELYESGEWNGKVFVVCVVSNGLSPADLIDTGDPAEHMRQKDPL